MDRFLCRCGHDLDRHVEKDACDVQDCGCPGFEMAWDEQDAGLIRS